MKNRRIVIIAILLVSVICLGVAFAALVDDLEVNGTLALDNVIANDDFNQDVHFDKTKTPSADRPLAAKQGENVDIKIEADANGHADDKLTITIPKGILNFSGDEVVVTAYVVNNSTEFDANVVVSGAAKDSEGLCNVTCKISNANSATVAKNGGTAPVEVTIKLIETVTGSESDIGGTFSFSLAATSVKPTAAN